MESTKLNIKELILVSKIKSTNEKIKWLVIGSFLLILVASMLTGLTLFSRYLNKITSGKREDIVVKVQMPEAKPTIAMAPNTLSSPVPMPEQLASDTADETARPEPAVAATPSRLTRHSHNRPHKPIQRVKHKIKVKRKPVWWAEGIRELVATRNNLSSSPEAKTVRPSGADGINNPTQSQSYIKIRDNLYFDPKTSKYLPK